MKLKVTCEHCSKKFERYECDIKSKVYCSKECSNEVHKVSIKCLCCKEKFKVAKHMAHRKYCSKECFGIMHKGDNNTAKTKEVRDKISSKNKGLKRTLEMNKFNSERNKGSLHYNWKGGISALTARIRTLGQYKQWRFEVFKRDNFTCQKCFKRGFKLNAHHKVNFSTIVKEEAINTIEGAENSKNMFNIDNGETLCKPCHLQGEHKWKG